MSGGTDSQYDPASLEEAVVDKWAAKRPYDAEPKSDESPYVIMMPLPNVTGALHMGHAMDNVLQDMLTRWHRMLGDNALWMAGTDHAGIATQAVVEKRLFELEGQTRHDIGRKNLVQRIWDWKEQYQSRIVAQQKAMGCSCDWNRQRFTMDKVCERAVQWTFFSLFRDGLIFRGTRLVNWDCHLQTAVSDDEIVHETVAGHFWHLRYSIVEPMPGEPDHLVVATTRPETMLGDTAIACHPDPAAALELAIATVRERILASGQKEKVSLEEELVGLEKRKLTHLPVLEQLAGMARAGRMVRLPLQDRLIPLICDPWAKPDLGSGCVKITPAHDPNDYEVWTRHKDRIGIINILSPDGTLNQNAGKYAGLDRFEARRKVVADLDSVGFLQLVEDREIEIGHSDRSKTPVEPYISEQWFIRMGDVDDGVVFGRGTNHEFTSTGLAQAAINAAKEEWNSATGRRVTFHPDTRYRNTYVSWLEEKRDWCISRQLWWGHQIPIWSGVFDSAGQREILAKIGPVLARPDVVVRLQTETDDKLLQPDDVEGEPELVSNGAEATLFVCLREPGKQPDLVKELEAFGLARDPDVLDTWFSSGLWPHSTLGWPDPETAGIDVGQSRLGSVNGEEDCLSYYYPGSCLVTGRDIITLWVARMVLMGLYNLGDVPFTDGFIHATILDGKGERMSKSKGNGIDPVDIIERYGCDAMRYVLCEMQTGSQDIRLPVQAISPFTERPVDLAKAEHGSSIFTYVCPETGKEFDVLGTMPGVPSARLVSERFEVGRHFCNKLWNAVRFALLNLDGASFEATDPNQLLFEDRWVLSRLTFAIDTTHKELTDYNPAAAISAARDFFWSDFCDWYLEMIKPRMRDGMQRQVSQQVLAFCIDQVLRLFHPFIPFLTEFLWGRLNESIGKRGIAAEVDIPETIARAKWPVVEREWRSERIEQEVLLLQDVIRAIRDIRSQYNVAPKEKVPVQISTPNGVPELLKSGLVHIQGLAGVDSLHFDSDAEKGKNSASSVVGDLEISVLGVVDAVKERKRLGSRIEKLTAILQGVKKKLANEKFLARANPSVVEKERTKLGDLESELKTLKENLEGLV